MKLHQIVKALDAIAPTNLAESWDNVGLLAGDPAAEVTNAMLTIDYTPEVACEAAGQKCELIVAYHPPIFTPLKRVVAGSVVFDAIQRGVAIYSPHTALDVADGGTNDVLADILGLTDRGPLKRATPGESQGKLVTFVPASALDKVSESLFAAGAGRIGHYTSCSFRTGGTGTFFGEAGTHPSVGQAGRLEKVDEVKLETVVELANVAAIIGALRAAHPYEEPAFDLVPLAAPPTTHGIGRVGTLSPGVKRETLFATIKRELGIEHLLIAGPLEGEVRRAAVCAGSGGDLLDAAIAEKVDLYLTGEVHHHDALRAAKAGVTVVGTLHSNSERVTLKHLAAKLAAACPGLAVHQSKMDRDPFSVR